MSKTETQKDWSYLHERLDPLGWTPERNVVVMPASQSGDGKEHRYELFTVDEEGNLVINYYRPNGDKATWRRGDGPVRHYQVLRMKVPAVRADGTVAKYKHPSGTGTLPWFCPGIIDACNARQEVDTLVLVEGVLKAFAGWVNGLYTIGVPGIHNVKDKATGTLHAEVIAVLKALKPRQVVFLHDGDCRNLTSEWPDKPEKDLYTRPNSFFTSARNMGELLKDYARQVGFSTYYAHVVSDSIAVPRGMEAPKGLDDLLLAYAELKAQEGNLPPGAPLSIKAKDKDALNRELARREVVSDLLNFSAPTRFFERRPLDRPDKLRDYFHLRSAEAFYAAHQERIGDREFIYAGTKYQWDETESQLKIKVPSTAKKYVRVGTDYYKYIKRRNPHSKQLEEFLAPWKKGAIVDDNGPHFVQHIPRYDTFTNWPDHMAHQAVMDSCLNAYAPFMHAPDDDAGVPEATLKFMRHVFGDGMVEVPHPKRDGETIRVSELDLGLDYLKLLYEQPTQMLPILCLISKERGTGKTTWFNYLKHLFGANCTQIGAKDLEGDFNAHYASKLLVIIDEALISKQESVEKLKHLSTSKLIMVNNKGVAQYEQPFFGKFLIASNNIRNFIKTDDDEVRFWIRRIKAIPSKDLDLDLEKKMVDEVPAMLAYLRKRPMATERLFRSWFHPALLVTEALHEIRKHSAPTAKREIEGWLRGMFWAMPDVQSILMTVKDIRKEVFGNNNRVDERYLNDILKDELGVKKYGMYTTGKSITTSYSYYRVTELREGDNVRLAIQEVKSEYPQRPYEFRRADFVHPDEEAQVERSLVHARTRPEKTPEPVGAVEGTDDDLPF